ncbi:MAG: hypothetical protein H0T50_12920 [Gemmatimonadales bacterium]|nr:hypothetical protein [Gemmatimonadales bacterium]
MMPEAAWRRGTETKQKAEARRQSGDEIRGLEERLRAFDVKARKERQRFQQDVRRLQNLVRTTAKQMAQERQALQEEMRRMRKAGGSGRKQPDTGLQDLAAR